ncbi:LuxR C-terminal-related transcriptional regulator [Chloroflexota bacterium]
MTTPLLTTKLYIPQPRSDIVSRPRLIDQLNTGLSRKLTLISAPAGFGKTTLVSSWVEHVGRPVAWLSLDDGDNDLSRFLTHFITALQTIENEIGQDALVALQSPGPINIEAVLTALINEIAGLTKDILLILDDYHLIESRPIDQTTTFFVEHLPAQIHMVIVSRIDPSLPLSRLRARGQMAEIRAHNLRFTLDEATSFLNRAINFDISEKDAAALGERTEGWIAGLQMSALSIQGLKDGNQVAGFVNRFTGSDRYIHDYLVDEVLQQCPKETRDFLLQTAILHSMCAPLCDAVAGLNDSQAILEGLDTANLFIVPLDNQRHWYRYHHLFADLLKHRLSQVLPERCSELHFRASKWYENSKRIDDAIHHAQASGKPERLTEILEEHWQVIVHRGQFAKLKSLLDSLGLDTTRTSAPLSMAYCWIGALTGSLDPIPSHLADIRTVLDEGGIIEDAYQPNRIAVIPSLVETMEAIIALDKDQAKQAKEHALKAITLIPDVPDPVVQGLLGGAAGYRLAEAHLKLGEFDEAYKVLLEVMEMLKASDNCYGAVAALQQIVAIYQKVGKINEGIILCEDMLQFMSDHQWKKMPPSGIVNLILADLQVDSGQFEEARMNLEIGKGIVKPIESPQILMHIKRVEKKLENATSSPQPLVELLSDRELEVLLLVAQGLTNREISERLYLALDTVKGHNRRTFGKLGVQNRTEAVNRARDLGLL